MTALFAGPVYGQQDLLALLIAGIVSLLALMLGSFIVDCLTGPKIPDPGLDADGQILAVANEYHRCPDELTDEAVRAELLHLEASLATGESA